MEVRGRSPAVNHRLASTAVILFLWALAIFARLILLQVTLGPVLEEILFRGYLFALLLWGFAKTGKTHWNGLVIPLGALVFAIVHLSQPGASWLQMACITSTGVRVGLKQQHFHRF